MKMFNRTKFRKRLLITIIYLFFLGILLEINARVYYVRRRGLSFFDSAEDLVYTWYPELRDLKQYKYEEDSYNVLIFGGSAITKYWGSIPEFTKKKFNIATGKKLNLVNLAFPAHNSLDSFYKYRWLDNKYFDDKHFDLVIFYHGINEARANNVPPELWEDDYSHYAWYNELNFYFNHPRLRKAKLLLPYAVRHTFIQLDRKVIRKDKYFHPHTPRPEWLKYGKDIKSKVTFQNNLLRIINIAKRRKETLMVLTSAYYDVAAAAKEGLSSDGPNLEFSKLWGNPEYTILGIDTHNDVIKHLARHNNFVFLDQEELLGKDKRYFRDICHLTDKGSEIFAQHLVDKIITLNLDK